MSVSTLAFSTPPKLVAKIRRNNDLLGKILEPEEVDDLWKVESYDFGTDIESWLQLFRACGFKRCAKNLDGERFFYSERGTLEYDPYDVWVVPPSQVKAMALELKDACLDGMRVKGLAAEVSDRRDNVISDDMYESFFGDLEDIKKFLQGAADQGHFLIFAEA